MRMGKTESGFNSSYCAFSAGKGPLSGQNDVANHGKGHFSENARKEGGRIKRLLWCLYARSGFIASTSYLFIFFPRIAVISMK